MTRISTRISSARRPRSRSIRQAATRKSRSTAATRPSPESRLPTISPSSRIRTAPSPPRPPVRCSRSIRISTAATADTSATTPGTTASNSAPPKTAPVRSRSPDLIFPTPAHDHRGRHAQPRRPDRRRREHREREWRGDQFPRQPAARGIEHRERSRGHARSRRPRAVCRRAAVPEPGTAGLLLLGALGLLGRRARPRS